MASAADRRLTLVTAIAAITAAVMFYAGTGLHPVAWLTWLAPFPVLLVAPRDRALPAGLAAGTAWVVGGTNMVGYEYTTLEQPLVVVVAILLIGAVMFAGMVLLVRALLLRGRAVAAAVALPLGWVSLEYLVSLVLPHGAFWSLAYTQADVPVVRQLAAVTGIWGITFLLLALPTVLTALIAPGILPWARLRLGIGAVVLASVGLGLGVWVQSGATSGGETVRVGLVAVAQAGDPERLGTPAADRLLAKYLQQVSALADEGATVVVLPEKVFDADSTTLALLSGPMSGLATERNIEIVVGLVLRQGGEITNTALDFRPDTGTPARYDKQHLIPGLESDFTPGATATVLPGSPTFGLVVCKDMDFPGLIRTYRQQGADLLLVPAWDFGSDAWLHSRMATLRGIESGIAVARTARDGALTVSDGGGRVVAEDRTGSAPAVSLTVDVTVATGGPTPYARFGDWFAWLCLLGLAATAARLRRTGARGPDVAYTPRETSTSPGGRSSAQAISDEPLLSSLTSDSAGGSGHDRASDGSGSSVHPFGG